MEELQSEIKKYHSSFDVFGCLPSTKDVKKIKEKLLLELSSEEFDTEIELHRTWNLISFLCFVLKDFTEAESYAEKVLESDPDNMIALSNKTWFSLKTCSVGRQCRGNYAKLESLKENKFVCLVAKAEIAFTYSRLGVIKYDRAKSLYQEVIEECDEIIAESHGESKLTTTHLCVWLFGYALVQKRLLNYFNTQNENELDLSDDKYRSTIELYCRIIQLDKPSESVKRYQARAYVDLGHISYSISSKPPGHTATLFPDNADLPEQTEDYFTTALSKSPNDVYVLERSGQYFRYNRKIERSIDLLEKAIEIKGTSRAYHHLALSLRRKLDIDVGNVVNKPFKRQFKRSSDKSTAIIEHLKTPFQPKPIDYKANKDVADKILRLYETSFEKAFNTAAINDQGLFYRQLGMPEKALESFEYLIKNEDEHSSRVDIASAFEQAGLCLQQMLNKQPAGDQRKDMEQLMKMYWKSSIEISCNLVSKVPSMNKGWKSPSALKSTIGYANTKDDKLDLLFLYKKMGCNEEALGVLNELETLPKTEGEKIKILKGKVDNYRRLGLYDDAMITLSKFPNVLDELGKELCMQIYVEAGIDDLKTGYSGKARGRIQRAFDVLSSPVSRDKKCDIFILCSTDYENKGRKLLNIINLFGLDATLNSDRVLPGTPELSGITNEMKKSKHFVIISDFNAGDQSVANHMQHMTAQLQAIVEERKAASSGVMVLKAKSHDPLPDMFRAYQRIDMDLNAVPMDFPEEFTKDENCSQGVKEILLTVLLTS